MNASRIAAVLILGLAAWLAVEAWLLVAPVLEQSWASGMAGRIFVPFVIPLALAIWLWRR